MSEYGMPFDVLDHTPDLPNKENILNKIFICPNHRQKLKVKIFGDPLNHMPFGDDLLIFYFMFSSKPP